MGIGFVTEAGQLTLTPGIGFTQEWKNSSSIVVVRRKFLDRKTYEKRNAQVKAPPGKKGPRKYVPVPESDEEASSDSETVSSSEDDESDAESDVSSVSSDVSRPAKGKKTSAAETRLSARFAEASTRPPSGGSSTFKSPVHGLGRLFGQAAGSRASEVQHNTHPSSSSKKTKEKKATKDRGGGGRLSYSEYMEQKGGASSSKSPKKNKKNRSGSGSATL